VFQDLLQNGEEDPDEQRRGIENLTGGRKGASVRLGAGREVWGGGLVATAGLRRGDEKSSLRVGGQKLIIIVI